MGCSSFCVGLLERSKPSVHVKEVDGWISPTRTMFFWWELYRVIMMTRCRIGRRGDVVVGIYRRFVERLL